VPGRRPKFTAITRTACLDFSNLQPTSQTCTHLLPTTCEALQRCSTACTPPELRLNVDSTAASRPTKLSKPTIQETQTALLRHDWPKVRNARCPQPSVTAVRAQASSSCTHVTRPHCDGIKSQRLQLPGARSIRKAEIHASESANARAATLALETASCEAAAAAAADVAAASQGQQLQGTDRVTPFSCCRHTLGVAATAAVPTHSL
jgi:hypothetical protein